MAHKYNVGDKVRFIEETHAENVNEQTILIPEDSIGTVEKVINESSLYVKVRGRKVIVFTWEVEPR